MSNLNTLLTQFCSTVFKYLLCFGFNCVTMTLNTNAIDELVLILSNENMNNSKVFPTHMDDLGRYIWRPIFPSAVWFYIPPADCVLPPFNVSPPMPFALYKTRKYTGCCNVVCLIVVYFYILIYIIIQPPFQKKLGHRSRT